VLEDHLKFAVLHIHVQQYIVPYINCLIGLFKVLLLIYWRWSNRDGICVDNRNIKTCAKRFLSTFDRNVIIQWPFKYWVWLFPQLCENILPTTPYRLPKGTITNSLDINTFRRCCGFFRTPCIPRSTRSMMILCHFFLSKVWNTKASPRSYWIHPDCYLPF